jgi:hypothetical protein
LPCLRRKIVLSIETISKPFASKKDFKCSYQSLGACLKPYKVVWRLKTWFRNMELSKLGATSHKPLPLYTHSEKHF